MRKTKTISKQVKAGEIDPMVIVRVHMISGRSPQQKKDLIAALCEVASSVVGVPKEAVRVLLLEISKDGWGIAGRPFSNEQS